MRRIVFEERTVDTRETRRIEIFSITEIESHFNETLKQILSQLELANMLNSQGYKEEGDEILRSQVVFIEGAYDYFLHELLRLGLNNLYKGYWENKGQKYLELQVSLGILKLAMETEEDDWLKEWITEKYSYITLMDYSLFKKEVCNLLGINISEVADLAFYKIDGTEKTVSRLEREICDLYKRRNQIAHQSDRKMGTAEREEISLEYVREKISVVRKIILAICEIVREKGEPTQPKKNIRDWTKDLYARLVKVLNFHIIQLSESNSPT